LPDAPINIAIDAMGGDKAPEMVVRGLDLARVRFPAAKFLVYGDETRLAPLLAPYSELSRMVELRHSNDVVTNEDKPSQVLRTGRKSSMWLAVEAVSKGEAAGVVSAGNTGALMAVSKFVLRTLPGIDRPAIAGLFPTERGVSVMLDLGANVECNVNNLVEFAVMGEVFARTVMGIERPTVGLLNVGSEDMKGHSAVRDAAVILRDTRLPISYHGFIEGTDIGAGTVDVIVTDGFTGNVALKTAEGISKLYSNLLKEGFGYSLMSKIGYLMSRSSLNRVKMRMDPRRYNGAMFLGLSGIAIKSHGGTDEVGFANAVGVAADLVRNGFNDKIKNELLKLGDVLTPDLQQAAFN
jgi:glycerol-3-phosphate acyltransferase PlsX